MGDGTGMIYDLHLPGDFLAIHLTSNDEKWREVVSCARGGMNTYVEDKTEGGNYIFGNMSEDDGWQQQKKLQVCVKSRKLARSFNLNLKRNSLHQIERPKINGKSSNEKP